MNKLIAHRGDTKNAKENTLLAIKNAINNNDFIGFECDIRQTKDNYYILWHDPLYQGKLVKNLLYSQMENIITLQEILLLKTNKIIILDIKDPFLDMKTFYQIIKKHNDLNLYIMSFYDNLIRKINNKGKNYKLGVINYLLNVNEFNYDFLCISNKLLNKKIINNFKSSHQELFVYNIKKNEIKDKFPYYIIDNVNR